MSDDDLLKTFGDSIFKGLTTTNELNTIQVSTKRLFVNTNYIKAIYVDEIAKLVVVKFSDGHTEKVKCSEEDDLDVAVGVALAIARHLFGNHTRFYKHIVQRKTTYVKKLEPTEYDNYIRWCKDNRIRLVSETTFKKNKAKYLNKMKGEK